jgi:leader peptidase (prepilin peptidase)/N-methyltransferase
MSTPVLVALLVVSGLVAGSFLNVLIVRVPEGTAILRPASQCPLCEAPIALRADVPVISWVLLRGRCRSCDQAIPAGYPLVEVANAALWVVAALRFGVSWELLVYAPLFSVLLALSVIDLELYILPNRIIYPAILASLVAVPALAMVAAENPRGAILGAAVGGVFYAGGLGLTLIAWELIVHKEGMGAGDVKLAVVLGLWIGFLHPVLVLYSIIAASVIGLVVGLGIFVVRRASRPYPFGPWLALGAVGVIVFSEAILDTIRV